MKKTTERQQTKSLQGKSERLVKSLNEGMAKINIKNPGTDLEANPEDSRSPGNSKVTIKKLSK